METSHSLVCGDARSLAAVADESVELVVTSPPYPMIEMWDELFTTLDDSIGTALTAGDGDSAFSAMHDQLDRVWDEVERVLVDGGIACVNVGDATRSVGDSFQVYPNHARVLRAFRTRGFDPLPDVLWRKPTNSAAKFMGSGTLPPNAYVTLEHEYVLVFRKGTASRSFPARDPQRYESAFFWEERNRWFSDVWTDIRGELQRLPDDAARERSGAYPFELPYRLICMYSTYDDTVLDPFLGTGTTTQAAMVAARNSVGYELNDDLVTHLEERVDAIPELADAVLNKRLAQHRQFVDRHREEGKTLDYEATHYDMPVVTSAETDLRFYEIDSITSSDEGWHIDHTPFTC